MDHVPCKYEPRVGEDLDAKAHPLFEAEILPSEDDPVTIRLNGECPVCGGHVDYEHPLEAQLRTVVGVAAGDTADRTAIARRVRNEDVTLHCNCGLTHPGQPEGEDGCGACFTVNVKWRES